MVIVKVENARTGTGRDRLADQPAARLPPAENDTEAPVAPPADFQNMMTYSSVPGDLMRRLLFLSLAGLWLLVTPPAAAGAYRPTIIGRRRPKLVIIVRLVLNASLTFLPAILLMMTRASRIIIVFGLLRNAWARPQHHKIRYSGCGVCF